LKGTKKIILWILCGLLAFAALLCGGIFLQDYREEQAKFDFAMYSFGTRQTLTQTYPDGTDIWEGYPPEHIVQEGNRTTIQSAGLDARYIYVDGTLAEVEIGDYDLFGSRSWKHYDVRDKLHLYRVMLPEEVNP